MVIKNSKKELSSPNKNSGQASAKNDKIFQPKIPSSKSTGLKILVVVESPKKISKIASYLPKDNTYKLLPSVGHITDLAKDGKYNLGLNLDEGYTPKFVLSDDRKDVIRAILDTAKAVDKVLIATDPDREGEHIGYSVAEAIKHLNKPIKRIEIHEITKKGVIEALDSERDIDINLVQAAISRRVLDRVVGFLVSPLVIKRLGKGLSAGRVQSVALRLLVERELEIEAFNAEEYWVIQATLLKFASDIPIVAKLQGDKITNKKDALALKSELENATYFISNVLAKEVSKNPPTPITTSRLQQLASGRYGFSGERTMKAAQKLYEEGDITYIRTDSVRQSDEAIDDIRDWIKCNKPSCLPVTHHIYKNKGAAQDAHESIRPTHINDLPKDKAATDEDKLYKLIWEITVASQMTPALYDTTTVIIETNNKKELKTIGRILKDPGWLSITQYADIEKEDDQDTKLPAVIVGDVLTLKSPSGVTADQKFTQPPKRYSEGSLIKELEKRGIGRPSTYADITKKITTREYVSKKGNSFIATDVGKKLVEFLCKYFPFMEYNYTSNLELKLDDIAKGEYNYLQMMQEFYPSFKKNVSNVYYETENPEYKFTCECGKAMYIKKSTFGHFLGCSGYPNCKKIVPCELIDGKIVLTRKYAPSDQKCPICNSDMYIRDGKFGKFYSCSTYPACKGWRKMPYGKKCPKCGGELYRTVFNRPPHKGPVLCCLSYPNCTYIEDLNEENFEEDKRAKKQAFKEIQENVEFLHKKNPSFSPDED